MVSLSSFQTMQCVPCMKPSSATASRSNSNLEVPLKSDLDKFTLSPKPKTGVVVNTDPMDIEESLMQLIDEIGEEEVIKEIENMISASGVTAMGNEDDDEDEEKGTESGQKNSFVTIAENHLPISPPAVKMSMLKGVTQTNECHYEDEDNSPPDSGYQNYSSTDAISQRPFMKQNEFSRRTKEYARCGKAFTSMDEGSDFASMSDLDELSPPPVHFNHLGVSGSSTSLADRHADSRGRGWGIIRDRYLPQKDWKGSSVPTSLNRDYWNKVLTPVFGKKIASPRYSSPEPQRRVHLDKRTTSMRTKGSAANLISNRYHAGLGFGNLTRTCSVGMMHHSGQNNYCISESDADTIETAV